MNVLVRHDQSIASRRFGRCPVRPCRRPGVFPVCAPILLTLVLVTLGACTGVQNIGQRSQPTQLYILSGLERPADAPPRSQQELVLGVGPVQIADHLNRPQILGMATANRLEAAEFHHWAAPLDRQLARVLAENLSVLLGTQQVVTHPWPRAVAVQYQVSVDLLHFEATQDGGVRLVALWRITDADGRTTLAMQRSAYRQTVVAQPNDMDARVAAFSRLVASLSTEMAERLRGLAARA